MAENFLPQVINIPKSMLATISRTTLSLTFVLAAARVVFNIKSRIVRENTWQLELKGDLTKQRRMEALDKLLSLGTIVVASIFGVKALGMDVNSVLAIGGVGGVAVGLAGREILENLFTGLIILSSNPFEVGDEVMFRPTSGQVVEGIVVDVGWYRTTIRSFEREIFIIPNSVFSRNVVLNITRKNREWRFYEFLHLRLEDLPKANAVVSDIRKILRQDNRIIQKLHRRVFLDKVTREDCTIYVSFYVEAANRDAFMAVKQDLLLAFIDCVERNGARLARNKLQLEMLPSLALEPSIPVVDLPALPQPVDITATAAPVPGVPPTPPASPPASGGTSGNGGSATTGAKVEEVCKAEAEESAAASNIISAPSGAAANSPPSPGPAHTGAGSSTSGSTFTKSPSPPASSSAPTSSSTGSGSVMPKQPVQAQAQSAAVSPSVQAVASALASSPTAAAKLTKAISPDAVMRGSQDGGSIILGSFDEPM